MGGEEDLNRQDRQVQEIRPLVVIAMSACPIVTAPARKREVPAHHECRDTRGDIGVLAVKAVLHG
jgi:hypothetical protein